MILLISCLLWFISGIIAELILVGTYCLEKNEYWKKFKKLYLRRVFFAACFGLVGCLIVAWCIIDEIYKRPHLTPFKWSLSYLVPEIKSKGKQFLEKLES